MDAPDDALGLDHHAMRTSLSLTEGGLLAVNSCIAAFRLRHGPANDPRIQTIRCSMDHIWSSSGPSHGRIFALKRDRANHPSGVHPRA